MRAVKPVCGCGPAPLTQWSRCNPGTTCGPLHRVDRPGWPVSDTAAMMLSALGTNSRPGRSSNTRIGTPRCHSRSLGFRTLGRVSRRRWSARYHAIVTHIAKRVWRPVVDPRQAHRRSSRAPAQRVGGHMARAFGLCALIRRSAGAVSRPDLTRGGTSSVGRSGVARRTRVREGWLNHALAVGWCGTQSRRPLWGAVTACWCPRRTRTRRRVSGRLHPLPIALVLFVCLRTQQSTGIVVATAPYRQCPGGCSPSSTSHGVRSGWSRSRLAWC